jgi:alkanesulfonate monooxygenase SsuD/methylene tetrahydromethanopterin reductase-like flavin-dependent oxidoreductase (luciferase family)
MEFGLIASSALPSSKLMSSKAVFDYAAKVAQVAHDSGFDCLGVSNKFLSGPAHQFMSPLVMVAYLASRFPDMYVTTNVFLLSYENPVRVAEAVATLDLISPGKFLFGIGQGYRADEARAFGISHSERGRRMAECIKAMKLLWQDGAASFDGEFWQFEGADIGAKPINGKGPPLLIAADAPVAISRIFERGGDYWYPSARCSRIFLREKMPVYRRALDEAKRPFDGLPLIRDICVAKDRGTAESIVRDGITDYFHRQSSWGQPGENQSVDFETIKTDRVILGSSEQAAEEIISLHDEFGAKFMSFRVFFPGMDLERSLDVVRQLGAEVLPLVRREVGTQSMFS